MAKGHIYYWRYDTRAGPIRYWEMPLFHIILAHRNTTFERLPLAIAITNTSLTVSLYTHTYHGYFYLVLSVWKILFDRHVSYKRHGLAPVIGSILMTDYNQFRNSAWSFTFTKTHTTSANIGNTKQNKSEIKRQPIELGRFGGFPEHVYCEPC